MDDTRSSFGDILRHLRSRAALSQEELAERAGLSRKGISDLERGARRVPRLETVRMLADALALSAGDRAALLTAARPVLNSTNPPAPAASASASLPAAVTRLIGREAELAALRTTLQDDEVRLVTLTGPGGIGKTRLAVEVASTLGDDFAGGIIFVDLAPLTDVALVPTAIV